MFINTPFTEIQFQLAGTSNYWCLNNWILLYTKTCWYMIVSKIVHCHISSCLIVLAKFSSMVCEKSDVRHAQIQSREGSRPPPLKNHLNIGFLNNYTCPNPLKITKLQSQHSMLGHHRHASETPLKWRFAGGTMMARCSGIWILPNLIN